MAETVRVSRQSVERMIEILDAGFHGNKTDAAMALIHIRNALGELLEVSAAHAFDPALTPDGVDCAECGENADHPGHQAVDDA
jgi:hypothetical protein